MVENMHISGCFKKSTAIVLQQCQNNVRFSSFFAVVKPILCEGALRHRDTRELYSNNLRAVGPKHTQLKTKQNRKQDNKTINIQAKHPCPNTLGISDYT